MLLSWVRVSSSPKYIVKIIILIIIDKKFKAGFKYYERLYLKHHNIWFLICDF